VETAGKNEFKGTVTIGIDKDGSISFSTTPANNRTVTDAELLVLLEQVKKVDRDIPVLIKADETTQLKKLAFVMDACRKTGLNKFSLQSR
jgi:biopolymer transport protein ExbD